MIWPRIRRYQRDRTIASLYGTIVAQARNPSFYQDYAVPDTVAGRFDMILLHLILVIRRFGTSSGTAQALGQALFDRFCADMDDNMSEMGIGDLAVPKHMMRVGEAYYGRRAVYDAALAAPDDQLLIDAIARNVYDRPAESAPFASALAHYVGHVARDLAALDTANLEQGRLAFPVPEPPISPASV